MLLARKQNIQHVHVKTKADLVGTLIARQPPVPPPDGRSSVHRSLRIPCLGLSPVSLTPTGFGQVNSVVLQILVGKPDSTGAYTQGRAYAELLSSGWHPAAAQRVTAALAKVVALDACSTLIETFLRPLPDMVSSLNRIHCSLNINTETGRLSSRRPNLQNQPALEKDVYMIRKAFRASAGNTLIVADYGQLELRVLAHVSNCKSMIQAFIDGGDFHSRTAINMFTHVKEAVDKGAVLLEKGTGANAHLPLLKDVYASERRKAKTLNFSIAYGKTAFGLAKDWGVTKEQAQDILELWYRDRPEVRAWQERVKAEALNGPLSEVYTLMGRTRSLPGIKESRYSKAFGGASRMAVNTPIQGACELTAAELRPCSLPCRARDCPCRWRC
jgi:DNA polymerase-1